MQVACPSCAHVLTVPPERAAPGLKAKCRCGTVFDVAAATRAGSAPSTAAPPAPPRPAAAPHAATPFAGGRVRVAVAPAVIMSATPEELTPPPLPARPAAVARPASAGAAAAAAPSPAAAPSADRARPGSVPIPWRRCQNHPQTRSEHVCPPCAKVFCAACTQEVRHIPVCPVCEGLAVPARAYHHT